MSWTSPHDDLLYPGWNEIGNDDPNLAEILGMFVVPGENDSPEEDNGTATSTTVFDTLGGSTTEETDMMAVPTASDIFAVVCEMNAAALLQSPVPSPLGHAWFNASQELGLQASEVKGLAMKT